MLQNIGDTVRATIIATARQGLTFAPTVLLLPLLTRALYNDALLGIELAQTFSDFMTFLISIPLGMATIRDIKKKMEAIQAERAEKT